MKHWTLENPDQAGGAEDTLANWGVDDFNAEFASQAEDRVNLSANGRRYDAAFLFPYKSTVIVRQDRELIGGVWTGGSIYFRGIVAYPSVSASGRREAQQCALIGPWWFFNERAFEQEYRVFNGWLNGDPKQGPTFATRTTNRIFLNLKTPPEGGVSYPHTGEQLSEICEWVLKPFADADADPPFQIGTLGLAVNAPVDEVKNITCAEAARKMLRWSPDAVAWFDYTTEPPTFNVQRRAALTAFNLNLTAIKPVSLTASPRHDLQRPFVRINYERTNSDNGVDWLEIVERVYPDPAPAGVINQFSGVPFVIDLRGYSISTIEAQITTRAIDLTSTNWWLDHSPDYKQAKADGRVKSFTLDVDSVTVTPDDDEEDLELPNELVGGQPAGWIPVGNHYASFQRVTVSCKAAIEFANGGKLPDKTFSFQMVTTDAASGTYRTDAGSTAAEPIPENLERDLYEAVSVLPWQGSLSFRRADLGGLPRIGHKLNLLGSDRAELATMDAIVQRVSENALRCTTDIEFGPPPHLNEADLLALFRVTRNREMRNPSSMRSGGSVRNFNAVLGKHTARANNSSAGGNWEKVIASGSPTPATEPDPAKQGTITHDGPNKKSEWSGSADEGKVIIDLAKALDKKTIEILETRGCDPATGEARYALVLRSKWYAAPLAANQD